MLTHSVKVDNGDSFFFMEKTFFNCSLCPNKFTRRDNLMRHVQSHHNRTGENGENENINFYKGNFISRVIPEEIEIDVDEVDETYTSMESTPNQK